MRAVWETPFYGYISQINENIRTYMILHHEIMVQQGNKDQQIFLRERSKTIFLLNECRSAFFDCMIRVLRKLEDYAYIIGKFQSDDTNVTNHEIQFCSMLTKNGYRSIQSKNSTGWKYYIAFLQSAHDRKRLLGYENCIKTVTGHRNGLGKGIRMIFLCISSCSKESLNLRNM